MRFSFLQKVVLCGIAAAICLFPVIGANVPAGYSVYSYEELKIGNSAGITGGIIGGRSTVQLGLDARTTGSIISNGAVTLWDRSRVDGDVKSGRSVTLKSGATVGGTILQYQTIPTYTIPTKTVTTGTTNKTVPDRGSMTIAPGNYNTIIVGNGATVTLNSGTYNINTLTIRPDAKVKLDFPSDSGITINVKTSFTWSDRVRMEFVNCTDGSKISVYYHGTTAFSIGNDAVAYGAFSAPNASFTVNDRAQFNGTVFAKKVELRPGLFAGGMIDEWLKADSDGDGVPDYVETAMGTNSSNPNDKPAVVVEGTYANKTAEGPQAVALSVDHEIGYSRNKVRMTFPEGSLNGDLIPIVDIISKPSNVDTIPTENWNIRLDGVEGQPKIFSIKGSIKPDQQIYMGFPLSDAAVSLPAEFLRIYHYVNNKWQELPVDAVMNGVAYAYVTSFSYYAVGMFENLVRVNPNFTEEKPGDFTSVEAAFIFIRSSEGSYGNEKYVVLIKGNETYAVNAELPVKTSIIAGFYELPEVVRTTTSGMASGTAIPLTSASGFKVGDKIEIWNNNVFDNAVINSINGNNITLEEPGLRNSYNAGSVVRAKIPANLEVSNDPRKNPTTFVQKEGNSYPILQLTEAAPQQPVDIYIDGITFANATVGSDISLHAVVYLRSGSYWNNLYIKNCVFLNNSGQQAAALYLFNVFNVFVQSCVFAGNITSGDEAGAVCVHHVFNCGVGANFESCVFYNNHSSVPGATNTATILNKGNSETHNEDRYISIYNCTFYGNNGTATILALENDNKLMPIENSIFVDNTQAIVEPSSYLPPNSSNLTSNPAFVDVSSPAAIIGQDNIWGTHDDGLQLSFNASSNALNAITTGLDKVPEFDVTGRRRIGIQTQSKRPDKGAYERYINILTVGDYNTVGHDGVGCYQAYLKKLAETDGYLIDFVGPLNTGKTYSANCNSFLGRDPSYPSNYGIYDIQTAAIYTSDASNDGTVAYFNSPEVFNKIVATNFDVSLVMMGSLDVKKKNDISTISNGIKSFCDALAISTTKPVFVSCIPSIIDDILGLDPFYNFNYSENGFYSINYTNAIRIGTDIADINTDDAMKEYLTKAGTNHITVEAGFERIATFFWNAISDNF